MAGAHRKLVCPTNPCPLVALNLQKVALKSALKNHSFFILFFILFCKKRIFVENSKIVFPYLLCQKEDLLKHVCDGMGWRGAVLHCNFLRSAAHLLQQ